jgi:hypothetical protein
MIRQRTGRDPKCFIVTRDLAATVGRLEPADR